MNAVIISGRMVADPELKQTNKGISVCSFTVAVSRPNVKDTVDFINCVAWRQTAEFICKYFKKGNGIALQGVLTGRRYKDNNNNNRTAYEVVIDRAEFSGSKEKHDQESEPDKEQKQETSETYTTEASAESKMEEVTDDDELPF